MSCGELGARLGVLAAIMVFSNVSAVRSNCRIVLTSYVIHVLRKHFFRVSGIFF